MSRPAKKRKTTTVEEIKFNDDERHEYLNGFHKRKLERIKRGQELAAKKAHDEKLAHRRQLRQERRGAALERVEAFNKMREEATKDTSDESNVGEDEISTAVVAPTIINHEDEYIDEERFTTVTVEAVDISKEGLRAVADDEEDDDGTGKKDDKNGESHEIDGKKGARAKDGKFRTKEKGVKAAGAAKKRKKFRYESKAERKVERVKQRMAKNRKRKRAE
ncbi:MAG: F-box protein: endocytic membrane traffic, recycling ReCYcling 1 [Watsoniomyces obsoletus]|nr:MAG: F-box protein: endocytic membrane traffic, recycling ReCYcling 1 [Watsoniomyces obsoletus]